MAGFIIGFDGEKSGSGERIVQFAEQTAIPLPCLACCKCYLTLRSGIG